MQLYFYLITIILLLTQATTQVHLIQSSFTKITADIHFGPKAAKIEAKIDKYYFPIPVILALVYL